MTRDCAYLNQPPPQAELNFHMFLGIIDMGSSFDELLQGKVQRTYRQAMQYGVLGLHLSGQTLDTVFMLNKFSAYHIVTVFGIDASEELPVRPDLPYVTMSRPVCVIGVQVQAVVHAVMIHVGLCVCCVFKGVVESSAPLVITRGSHMLLHTQGPLQHLQAALVNTVRATGKTLQAMGKVGWWLHTVVYHVCGV